jgi:hypothetical protein
MKPDPVIEEIRRNAAAIAEECGGDIRRMADRFRREQAENVSRVVRRRRSNRQTPQMPSSDA